MKTASMSIRISIIIPAFKAAQVLPRALASIAGQNIFLPQQQMAQQGAKQGAGQPRLKPHQVEVVIAADDHHDYRFASSYLPHDMKCRCLPPVSMGMGISTGPGATRNRGIAASTGAFLAFLDADDTWSPDYLTRLWPLAWRHGACFAITSVLNAEGKELMVLGQPDEGGRRALPSRQITPRHFGVWPGSFHPVVRRDLSPGFDDGAGQDVFHALEVLGRVGGRAPLVQSAAYQLHLSPGSVTANPAFTRRIDRRYRDWQRRYQHQQTALTGMARRDALQALSLRRAYNHAFAESGGHQDGFYGFLAK